MIGLVTKVTVDIEADVEDEDLDTEPRNTCVEDETIANPFLLVQDPELIKKVLVSDFEYFSDRSVMLNKNDKYAAKTLFLMKNPNWKLTRTKVTSAFSYKKLKYMLPQIIEAGEELVATFEKNALGKESINCRAYSVQYAINVISACAFGYKARAHDTSKFAVAAQELQGTTFLRGIQLVSHFFAPMLVNLFRMKFCDPDSAKYLEQVLLGVIKERTASQSHCGDLVDLLIKMNHEDERFDNDALVSLSLQYLVAGFETSGATIAFTLHELSLNQSVQNRLRNEILTVLEQYGEITSEAIQEMKYLDMVVKETLRKYPTLAFLDRRCTKDYKIPNSDVTIEKGIPMYISLWSLHYDENYFPEPTKFDPERFSPENKSNIHPYTYMPFGEGYRNCLGTKLGILSVCVGIIQVLRKFKIEKSVDTPETLTFENGGFLIIPKGAAVYVKFKSLPY
ncbi:hypothetical protein RN001_012883 [Aquatica leii]|uniref:Cytochrome P450 n=1 Tax=Aquatica leii TaxID=1421715 RepID=A0AAN7P6W8_9COLE|nr:hypothetical protein RN001_012883 [Aquatica leii]